MSQKRLTATQKRQRLRAAFAADHCVSPASVFDALSARVAESVGYELAMLGGSVASAGALAAPDLTVLTLTELAGVARSICRNSNLALFIDSDHGFGNALSVRRTIEELEHAGASGCSIEDTHLPARFGAKGEEIISKDEMVGKLKAALAARMDSSFIIAGRTIAMKSEGLESTIARVKAYAETGVDTIFLLGVESLDQLRAVRAEVNLPLMLGTVPEFASREEFAQAGVRIALQGHQPQAIAVEALRQAYVHLHGGGSPDGLKARVASSDFMDLMLQGPDYRDWRRDYLAQD